MNSKPWTLLLLTLLVLLPGAAQADYYTYWYTVPTLAGEVEYKLEVDEGRSKHMYITSSLPWGWVDLSLNEALYYADYASLLVGMFGGKPIYGVAQIGLELISRVTGANYFGWEMDEDAIRVWLLLVGPPAVLVSDMYMYRVTGGDGGGGGGGGAW